MPTQTSLAAFMKRIREAGIPRTLHDHLIEAGFDRDRADYLSMKGMVTRALTNGQTYAKLANELIFRSHRDRGKICDLLEPMEDDHPMPLWNTSIATRETIGAIENKDFYFTGPGGTKAALTVAESRIARQSRPMQKDVLNGINSMSMELDIVAHDRDQWKARAERAEGQVDVFMRRLPGPGAS